MKSLKLPKIWPAIASGLLVVAAFPPLRLALLVFIALVPWLNYLRECDGKRAFRSGYVFGFAFWLGEFSFVGFFVSKWTHSVPLGLVPYLLGCAIASLYFALFGWLANLCYRVSLPWLIPIAWAGVEVFRSYIIQLAFPFGLLATPLTGAPVLIQSAHYGTVYLTSAWIVLANVIVAELMVGKRYLQVRWHVAAFFLIFVLSIVRFASEPQGELRTVAAGQLGIDMAYSDPTTLGPRVADSVNTISKAARGADLLVLPEGLIRAGSVFPPPVPFRVDASLPIIFGAQRGESPSYQSAFSFDGHWDYADKTRLVIFGEYVPFRNLSFMQSFDIPDGDLRPAEQIRTLNVGKLRVGGALCFEALFPDVTYKHALNGANILAVMSVDDWYFGTNAPELLRDASSWRAVEMGVPAVRAAPLGYSDIIDARGQTVAEAPLGVTKAVIARVRVPAKPDLFPFLPVFPILSVLSIVGIPLFAFAKAKRNVQR